MTLQYLPPVSISQLPHTLPNPSPSSFSYYSPNIFHISKIKNKKKWTTEEDFLLISLADQYKEKHWKSISTHFPNKNPLQCFSRYKRIRPGIIKGSWSKEEDAKIINLVKTYGKSWSKIAKLFHSRNGKQIRDRYTNVLDPEITKGKFTDEEDKLLIKLYINYGPKWAIISKNFPNRTADMIKNRFHSSIKKIFFSQEIITRQTKTLLSLKEKKMNAIYENELMKNNRNGNRNCNVISNSQSFSYKSENNGTTRVNSVMSLCSNSEKENQVDNNNNNSNNYKCVIKDYLFDEMELFEHKGEMFSMEDCFSLIEY